jgi:multidrug resistance efflux pump
MIAFIAICYASLYFVIFNKFKLLPKTTANIAVFAGVGVVIIASIVFAWRTFAPISSDARVVRLTIPIVSHVKGRIIELNAESLKPMKQGEVLWKIDPRQYQYQVDQLQGTLKQHQALLDLNRINLQRVRELVEKQAASKIQLDTEEANVRSAEAAIEATTGALNYALWELEETVVHAPADGFPANVFLHVGTMVTKTLGRSPIAWVSTDKSEVAASFSQSASRRIKPGDPVEIVFKSRPGQVFSGRIAKIGKATGEAQLDATSTLTTWTGAPANARWPHLITLADEAALAAIPQGAGGTVAVYTDAGRPFHAISKVVMRMQAWTGYLTSP